MGQRTCSVKDCDKPTHSKGMCGMHAQRAKRHGDPLWEPPTQSDTCSVDGCEVKREARGLCHTHYSRWWTTGEIGSAERLNQRGRRCVVGDCEKPHCALGFCMMHYERFKKYGDPHKTKWVAGSSSVTYVAFHDRVRRARGTASSNSCVGCGDDAKDWAYDHADPDEVIAPSRDGRMFPVSNNIDHYIPLCRTCHRRFDLDHDTLTIQ